jgi:UDP-2-acetamido-2-deoxy-ribo-hexuluronate aminotransferase
MELVDLRAQYANLKSYIDARMRSVLEHGQFIMGPEVAELEKHLAERVGVPYCISCSSGTDALQIALMALGVGYGDEVVTTSFTYMATAEGIKLLGARPVFVDIDVRTYNLDPRLLEAAITPRTKAIIAVSLYGQCADMDAINEVAAAHRLPVIEDGAQSFGATYKGRPSCGLSTIGCTSFFPAKPLGCYGDGGACFTRHEDLAWQMRRLRVHGQEPKFFSLRVAMNSRLDTLQAAVLLAKLEIFDAELESRQRIAAAYNQLLNDVSTVPYLAPQNSSTYAMYVIQVENRTAFREKLRAEGIPTAVHYPFPLHLQPAYADPKVKRGSLSQAEAAADRVVTLPLHPYLSSDQQRQIVQAVRQAAAHTHDQSLASRQSAMNGRSNSWLPPA